MKFTCQLILSIGLFSLCACTIFDAKQSATPPDVLPPKPLALPVGNNWQIKEEAPRLSDERGRLPFQTEQSVKPEGANPLLPTENRKIETSR